MFTTKKIKSIIGENNCSPGADEIFSGSFTPQPNLLTFLQGQYFKNLEWKNKSKPKRSLETI